MSLIGLDPLRHGDPYRRRIQQHFLLADRQVLAGLLPLADLGPEISRSVVALASDWVGQIRQERIHSNGVDALLHEFSLSTTEGVVLMSLAEALMRVPDDATVDSFISDRLGSGDWQRHLGQSPSLFVNASTWGLLFTGQLVNYKSEDHGRLGNTLARLINRLGMPMVRRAVKLAVNLIANQFVFAEQIGDALAKAASPPFVGLGFSFDMLGEGARCQTDADSYFNRYLKALQALGASVANSGTGGSSGVLQHMTPGISIKLSAIFPRYEFSQRRRVMAELVPRLLQLAKVARTAGVGLTIDAEEAHRLDLSLDVFTAVFTDGEIAGWDGFGMAVQAYQKRALPVIEYLNYLASTAQRRIPVRLVKGAYWDTEIKLAQVKGLVDYPVFTLKEATDLSYLACARKLLEYRSNLYPQFATHNAHTIAAVLTMAGDAGDYEFQRLHGMGEELHDLVRQRFNTRCRVYAPVGEHRDLLAYLARRLLENGANTSFVSNLVDQRVAIADICGDPLEKLRGRAQWCSASLPLPPDLYGERRNAGGIDLADGEALAELQRGMAEAWAMQSLPAEGLVVCSPANLDDVVGVLPNFSTPDQMRALVESAQRAFGHWRQWPVAERADLLERFADNIERHRDQLVLLCVREAGKTLDDSLAEVREAVDYCRYYGKIARRHLANPDCQPLGVVLSIGPWNFPLAILVGQLCAALVAGNTLVVKPAEQTSLIAQKVVELLYQSGLPRGAVELVIAPGKSVGEVLINDPRIKAVIFTGSTATAEWIHRRLLTRTDYPIPFVAETGGQNAMIVDSTALPEQVVDDVVRSAFHSAGQRCSSLRVLFVQQDIAPGIIAMLKGAIAELTIGDPAQLSTDIGPIIDERALSRLNDHVADLATQGELLYRCPLPENLLRGYFFAPALYEIADIALLKREVFGPVLHLIRYSADKLDEVIAAINGTGYGLTLGIHSRVASRAAQLAERARVGNVYINRDMIGAVVGVHPFGGRGLSGTGSKSGGPHYLYPFVRQEFPRQSWMLCCQTESLRQTHVAVNIARVLADLAVAQRRWQSISVDERLKCIALALARLSGQGVLENSHCLALEQTLDDITEVLQDSPELRGATGERSSLFIEPRGVYLCLPFEQQMSLDLFETLSCTLLVGNAVLLGGAGGLLGALAMAGLPVAEAPAGEIAAGFIGHSGVAGLITETAMIDPVRPFLSARTGSLLPVITGKVGRHNLHFLYHEKTVTENTTAIGGNAALMARDD